MKLYIINSKRGGFNEVRINDIVPSIKIRWAKGAKELLPEPQRLAARDAILAAKSEVEESDRGHLTFMRWGILVTI